MITAKEKMFNHISDKGLAFRKFQEFLQLKIKLQNFQLKMDKGPEQRFLQTYMNGQ